MSKQETAVASFENVDDLRAALELKQAFGAVDLYPRDGTCALYDLEQNVAELVGVVADELLLCNSGMAAVVAALETATNADTTLAISEQTYAQTARYIESYLRPRIKKLVRFDSGCTSSVSRVLERACPDVVLSETTGNGPDVPILDVEHLLSLPHITKRSPVVILDNTLPLSTAEPLAEHLDEDARVVAVESGTKSYAFNNELLGILYTKHPQLLQELRERRRTTGITPNVAAIERISSCLPEKESFHTRNRAIFRATAQIAIAACEATADSCEAFVSHPILRSHPNHKLAAQRLQYGSSPVFFIHAFGKTDQFELTEKLWEHPTIRETCELGQSFGFNKTRILPDANYPAVRVSGGARSEGQQIGTAFAEVLSNCSA